jgi:hypothetical protein
MERHRSCLAVLVLLTTVLFSCGSGNECDKCSSDDDCNTGLVCSSFSDGSTRCGVGDGSTTCRTR